MTASKDGEETYLQLFIGYMDTALDNIGDVFSPTSSKLGIPDQLGKLGNKIQTLLGTEEVRWSHHAQHRTSTAPLSNTAAPLPNEESAEFCLSKLQDLSLTTEELMNVALILVDKTDMADIMERDDNTYECLVCKTIVSDTIRLMEHIHNVHHKLKQKMSRKMCHTNVKVKTEPSDLLWYVVSKINPLSPHCVTYLGPDVYHCTICNEVLKGNTEVVIDHNMEESHRNKYLDLHKKPAQQVDNPSLGPPTQAPTNTTARDCKITSMKGLDKPSSQAPPQTTTQDHVSNSTQDVTKAFSRAPPVVQQSVNSKVALQTASSLPPQASTKTIAADVTATSAKVVKKASFQAPSVVYKKANINSHGGLQTTSNLTSQSQSNAPALDRNILHDEQHPENKSTWRQGIDVLHDRYESFELKCHAMWQMLAEYEGRDITCDPEYEELWCSVCRTLFYSPFSVVEHVSSRNHMFRRHVEDKKSRLANGYYSGCRSTEERLMWEILTDVEQKENICDHGNYSYYCYKCSVDISGCRYVITHINSDRHKTECRR